MRCMTLAFLHVGTRRAFVTPTTSNPTEARVREQTQAYLQHAKANKLPIKMLFHDRDSKFTETVDADLAHRNIEVRKAVFRAPNTNASLERCIQTIQHECLDHFMIVGQRHFNHLVAEWVEHYHTERPHQAKDNELLNAPKKRGRPKTKRLTSEDEIVPLTEVRCKQRLGGLLKHYYRKAASRLHNGRPQ
jgi:putative transposase